MEKTARKPSADPTQERLRANKAAWNKEVSAFINDLIHFKKLMNGWPSKFFKERSRITQPLPADPATIIGSLAGDFQEIATRGNSVIEEQLQYSKNRRQRQPKPAAPAPGQTPQAPAAPAAPEAPAAPDLTQQLQKGLAASAKDSPLVKLAAKLEDKYELESQASNPFSRFVTRLFNPKFGFGEKARIRRLRMTMLDNCVKSYQELKKLHKEIVKSSKGSIINSHKMMTLVWNHWNIVNRLFATYRNMVPGVVHEEGGPLDHPGLSGERMSERKKGVPGAVPGGQTPQMRYDTSALGLADQASKKVIDYRNFSPLIQTNSPAFKELNSVVESIMSVPQDYRINALLKSNIQGLYNQALIEVNMQLGTKGTSFEGIIKELAEREKGATKNAQRQLGKLRHQILPGATSGSRLEIYSKIDQMKRDLNQVMDLLEKGFDTDQLGSAISSVNSDMSQLRTLMRSLYYSEKPEEASTPFF